MAKMMSCFMLLLLLASACLSSPASPQPTAPKTGPFSTPTLPVSGPTSTPAPAQPRYGGTLSLANTIETPGLDALWLQGIWSQYVLAPSYNGLVEYDPIDNFKVRPTLAESWEVGQDGRVYTFRLRKDVKWHDRQPFTSADVKATMDLWKSPPVGKLFMGRRLKEVIQKVDVPDPYVVNITLNQRSNSFIAFLAVHAIGSIMPKHILDKHKGSMENEVIGTGPFKFKNWQAGALYEAVKNPDYFLKGLPYLDGLRIYCIVDFSTRFSSFRTGQTKVIHPYHSLKKSEADIVKAQMPGADVLATMNGTNSSFSFNTTKPPWSDVRVRRALSMAVDRNAAITILEDGAGVIGTPIPPGLGGMSVEELAREPGYRQPKDQDLAEARKLLSEAGYPNGLDGSILVRARTKSYEDQSVFVSEQASKVGMRLKLDARETAIWTERRQSKNYETTYQGTPTQAPDPLGSMQYFGSGNDFGWEPPLRDELILKYDTAADPAEKTKTVSALERLFLDDVPYFVLYWRQVYIGYWKEVRNIVPMSGLYNNLRWEQVWLEK